MPQPTAEQLDAIHAAGNVLLMAGAGTGKTSTLVARCLHWLFATDPPGSLDRLLMVTFTDAAAAEMRNRIREALLQRTADPATAHRATAQLALLDTAHIRTLHSFNLELIRRHFLELQVDPQPAVLDAQQARLLQEEILDQLFERHYAARHDSRSLAVRAWIKSLGGSFEKPAREVLLQLYHQMRVLPDPQDWLDRQRALFSNPAPALWRQALQDGALRWCDAWREHLRLLPNDLFAAGTLPETIAHARGFAGHLTWDASSPPLDQLSQALREITRHNETGRWPKGQAGRGRQPLNNFLVEARELLAYFPGAGGADPLADDWAAARPRMLMLLDLLGEFDQTYAQAKRTQGALDFNDFEQLALQLLHERPTGAFSPAARFWREQFDQVFVDEYQDINPAQDAILRALAREGAHANRFLVGDVKQSIYRFRQADPAIFQQYAADWSGGAAHSQTLPLSQNFRSHESLLQFFNSLFAWLLPEPFGGVVYDDGARLQFGAPDQRAPLSRAADPPDFRRVEWHLLLTNAPNHESSASDSAAPETPAVNDALAERNHLEAEARLLARRLLNLKQQGFPVWRRDTQSFSPVDWRDMVVLLRAPRGRAETFAKEFARLGVPLLAQRGGLLEQQEISDLVQLLRLLDNPRQDLPLAAVLRSPLVGLQLDDLARIRLARRKGSLWLALQQWRQDHPAAQRVALFLERFDRWRRLARRGALANCLEAILRETLFDEWCQAQDHPDQRHANLQQFLHLARHFDTLQRQGLHRFLRYLEAYEELDVHAPSPAAVSGNCVRLMSIHQSKGLEFPVVAVATLGVQLNAADRRGDVLWSDAWGLCPRIHPEPPLPSYPSLTHWLTARLQREAGLSEELRLLYVALTRACDLLLLSGATTEQKLERWHTLARHPHAPSRLRQASTPLDWLGPWWLSLESQLPAQFPAQGCHDLFSWRVSPLAAVDTAPPASSPQSATSVPQELEAALWDRLNWRYPFAAATREPAKTTVSALRRRAQVETEVAEAAPNPFRLHEPHVPRRRAAGLSAADTGTAHHLFLEHCDFSAAVSEDTLRQEARRLQQAGLISPEQVECLRFAALARFWQSPPGRDILQHTPGLHRELPFTARLDHQDLRALNLLHAIPLPEGEFVVVQGVADLVVLLDAELWLLDFKTDDLAPDAVSARAALYTPQVQLYALALSRIYQRPATRLWLHFLLPAATVSISPPGPEPAE